MTKFERVQQLLQEVVRGDSIGAHGNFWNGLTLEQFTTKKVYGRRLVVPGDTSMSNLVLALRGLAPFGGDDDPYPRMPVGYDPMPEEGIVFIETWIADGCPDEEWFQTESGE